jgi:hypothetical protein
MRRAADACEACGKELIRSILRVVLCGNRPCYVACCNTSCAAEALRKESPRGLLF